jgi:hypothetical protein
LSNAKINSPFDTLTDLICQLILITERPTVSLIQEDNPPYGGITVPFIGEGSDRTSVVGSSRTLLNPLQRFLLLELEIQRCAVALSAETVVWGASLSIQPCLTSAHSAVV